MKSTPITTADNEAMVLFHEEPITAEDIAVFEALTRVEILAIVKTMGFEEHSL